MENERALERKRKKKVYFAEAGISLETATNFCKYLETPAYDNINFLRSEQKNMSSWNATYLFFKMHITETGEQSMENNERF